jgi:uncharacterized PurR-regulated membrane protein YhhQ (DUF165 family)
MEIRNETLGMGLVHRAIAFGLAVATTAFIATGFAIPFSSSPAALAAQIGRIAVAPLRALLG